MLYGVRFWLDAGCEEAARQTNDCSFPHTTCELYSVSTRELGSLALLWPFGLDI